MKPYFEDELVTLYHGDCLDVQDWLQADVLVTDPPYGVDYVSRRSSTRGNKYQAIAGDDSLDLRDAVLELWGGRPAMVFGTWRMPRPPAAIQLLVWDKGDSPGMGNLGLPWGPGHEEIYVFGDGWAGIRRTNVYRAKTYSPSDPRRPNHPTPKPVALMEALLDYAPPGVIADPFAGSGATLIAARNIGRRSIGVELEESYCELIAQRLSQAALVFPRHDEVRSSGWSGAELDIEPHSSGKDS